MAWPPLFDTEKCPVPYVPRVSFDFISNCEILPAPPPIFDCPDIEIPIDVPPPPFDLPPISIPPICIPCPTLLASATIEMGDAASVTVTVTPLHSNSSCTSQPSCIFLFDFHFVIPEPSASLPSISIPCPFMATSATITQGGDSATIDFTVTQTGSGGSCGFMFDLDINIPEFPSASIRSISVPCPTMETSATITQGGESATVNFTVTPTGSLGSCAFLFDLDINIPDFPSASVSLPSLVVPCPTISAHATITQAGESATVAFTVTETGSAGSCAFIFDLDITIPEFPSVSLPSAVCPTMSASGTIAYADIDFPELTFTVTKGDVGEESVDSGNASGGDCAFLFDLDIKLPPPRPCPEISVSATIEQYGRTPQITFGVTPTGGDGPRDPCEFFLDLHIVIPEFPSSSESCPCDAAGPCVTWVWCKPCNGGTYRWQKRSGGDWQQGDPPEPNFDGRMAGDAVITCLCPMCSSESLSEEAEP